MIDDDQETETITTEGASSRLRSLYMELDTFYSSEEERSRIEQAVQAAEAEYAHWMQPCFLCGAPTLFQTDAEHMCCWKCLNDDYHRWYKRQHYGPPSEHENAPATEATEESG